MKRLFMCILCCLGTCFAMSQKSAPAGAAGAAAADATQPSVPQLNIGALAIVDEAEHERSQPIHEAAYEGDCDEMRRLLGTNVRERAKIANSIGVGRCRPLHCAAESGHCEAIELLWRAGAEIDAVDCNGQSALHLAAQGGHAFAVERLLLRGANVRAKTADGSTPLHCAVWADDEKVVAVFTVLLRAGATVDEPDGSGYTPLLLAAAAQKIFAVHWLSKQGADVEKQTYKQENLSTLLWRGGVPLTPRNSPRSTKSTGSADSRGSLSSSLLEGAAAATSHSSLGSTPRSTVDSPRQLGMGAAAAPQGALVKQSRS